MAKEVKVKLNKEELLKEAKRQVLKAVMYHTKNINDYHAPVSTEGFDSMICVQGVGKCGCFRDYEDCLGHAEALNPDLDTEKGNQWLYHTLREDKNIELYDDFARWVGYIQPFNKKSFSYENLIKDKCAELFVAFLEDIAEKELFLNNIPPTDETSTQ